jgi:hypothetical protein
MQSIIFHSDCPDGIVSKEIIRVYLRNYKNLTPNIVPFKYGQSISKLSLHNSIWVDCCPESEEDFLLGLQNGCIYIDHHETVRSKFKKFFPQFSNQLIFGETFFGQSGASLTYDFVIKELLNSIPNLEKIRDFKKIFYKIQEFAALADTWQVSNKDFKQARAMSSLIKIIGNDIDLTQYPITMIAILQLANVYMQNKEKSDAEKSQHIQVMGFQIAPDNYLNVAILNESNISDISEILRSRENESADLIVGFTYIPTGNTFDVSYLLRSNDKFDCSLYAKSNGGGGHVKAAGFTKKAGYIDVNFDPINYIRDNLKVYLNLQKDSNVI